MILLIAVMDIRSRGLTVNPGAKAQCSNASSPSGALDSGLRFCESD